MCWRIFLMVRQEQLPGGSGGQEVAHIIHRMLGLAAHILGSCFLLKVRFQPVKMRQKARSAPIFLGRRAWPGIPGRPTRDGKKDGRQVELI
jgi:hypothetical protein